MNAEIKHTADGSPTLFLPGMNEQYHSLNGALTESAHVFLQNGYDYNTNDQPIVFEVGFGTGLNSLLTADRSEKLKRETFYITTEKFPLAQSIINQLSYGAFVPGNGTFLFEKIHECSWGQPVKISPWFTLLKLETDFTRMDWNLLQKPDIIYFDAFGPDKQPEMWEQEIFIRLFDKTAGGGVLVTYSAKGEVRRRMINAGFKVERLPGPPGKKEMLRAIKVEPGL